MGCGKSTVGRALADELGWSFFDLDEEIEKAAGESIAQIFERRGEAAFRELETAALQEARPERAHRTPAGDFARRRRVHRFRKISIWPSNHGVTVWLDSPLDVIERRVAAETHRPLARDPVRLQDAL